MTRNYLVILCLFFFTAAQAQVSVAVSGGLNSTTLTNPEMSSVEYRQLQNYYLGIAPVIGKDKIRLRLGLQGTYKGAKTADTPNTEGVRGFYADFLPEVEIRPIKLIGIAVGGTVGLNLSEQVNDGTQWQTPVTDIFNTTDYGFRAAGRLYLWRLAFEVAYNHGLGAATEYQVTDQNGQIIGTEEEYFRSFQIGMAYRFGRN